MGARALLAAGMAALSASAFAQATIDSGEFVRVPPVWWTLTPETTPRYPWISAEAACKYLAGKPARKTAGKVDLESIPCGPIAWPLPHDAADKLAAAIRVLVALNTHCQANAGSDPCPSLFVAARPAMAGRAKVAAISDDYEDRDLDGSQRQTFEDRPSTVASAEARFVEGLTNFVLDRAKLEAIAHFEERFHLILCEGDPAAPRVSYFPAVCHVLSNAKAAGFSLASASREMRAAARRDLRSLPDGALQQQYINTAEPLYPMLRVWLGIAARLRDNTLAPDDAFAALANVNPAICAREPNWVVAEEARKEQMRKALQDADIVGVLDQELLRRKIAASNDAVAFLRRELAKQAAGLRETGAGAERLTALAKAHEEQVQRFEKAKTQERAALLAKLVGAAAIAEFADDKHRGWIAAFKSETPGQRGRLLEAAIPDEQGRHDAAREAIVARCGRALQAFAFVGSAIDLVARARGNATTEALIDAGALAYQARSLLPETPGQPLAFARQFVAGLKAIEQLDKDLKQFIAQAKKVESIARTARSRQGLARNEELRRMGTELTLLADELLDLVDGSLLAFIGCTEKDCLLDGVELRARISEGVRVARLNARLARDVLNDQWVVVAVEISKLYLNREAGTARSLVGQYAPVIAEIAGARTSIEVQRILNDAAAPAGSYREKFRGTTRSITALVGGSFAWEWYRSEEVRGSGTALGLFAPVGIHVTWSMSEKGWFTEKSILNGAVGIFGSILDLGPYASFRDSEQGVDKNSHVGLKEVFSPGVFVTHNISSRNSRALHYQSPFVWGAGVARTPALLQTQSGRDIATTRVLVFFAVDVTMFPF